MRTARGSGTKCRTCWSEWTSVVTAWLVSGCVVAGGRAREDGDGGRASFRSIGDGAHRGLHSRQSCAAPVTWKRLLVKHIAQEAMVSFFCRELNR